MWRNIRIREANGVPALAARFMKGPQAFIAAALLTLVAPAVHAQTYAGVVLEAGSGRPIEGAVLRGSPGSYLDVTLADGVFEFGIPPFHRPLTVSVSRQGYAPRTVVFDELSLELVIELEVAPIELEGVSTELPFEERLAEVEDALNQRYAVHRGVFRSLGREDIRAFDEAHASDPYAMLTGGLDLYSDFDSQDDRIRTRMGFAMRFEVFVDEVRVPLLGLLRVPNDQICRAEVFHQTRLITVVPYREPNPQLRVYTCPFMARVAAGRETIEDRVCWNELVAWRRPSRGPSVCTFRR